VVTGTGAVTTVGAGTQRLGPGVGPGVARSGHRLTTPHPPPRRGVLAVVGAACATRALLPPCRSLHC
jgi:hypothetical protein